MMLGANSPGGVVGAGAEALDEWRDHHDGFVDITIDVPETIIGYAGLKVRSVTVGGPGLARTLHNARVPIMALRSYRRIWLSIGSSKLECDPAFVITPEGAIEVDVASGVLAAIAAGMPRDSARAANGEVRTGSAAEKWMQRSWFEYHAHQGAELVATWLSQFTTEIIR